MPYINKRIEADYLRLQNLETHGHILRTEALRDLCSAYDYNPEKIGTFFLELLSKWEQKERN